MSEEKLVKIYELRSLGYDSLIGQLNTLVDAFEKIKVAKRDLNKSMQEGLKASKEDSDDMKAKKQAYQEVIAQEIELKTQIKQKSNEAKAAMLIKQQEITQQKLATEGNKAEAGSYAAVAKARAALYALVKPANASSVIEFQGNTLTYDQAIAKLKELSSTEQAFRRQFQKDGTLVGEYTTGIVQAFKKMGLGDLIGGQVTKASARLQELDASFNKIKQDLSELKATGAGGFDVLERELIANRKEAILLNEQVGHLKTELRGAGDIGNQITTSIANGFKNAKGQIAQLVLSYVGFQAVFQGIQKAVAVNAELSDSAVDLSRNLDTSTKAAAGLVEELKKLDTRTSITELVDTANIAAKAGVTRENILGVVAAVDKLKLVFGSSLGNTEVLTESLIKLNNVFGKAGEVSEDALLKTGNAIVQLDKAGTASAEFLTDYASRVGAIAKAVGLSLPAVLGLGAGFQELGQTAEVSGTATIQIFNKIGANSEKFAKIAGKPLLEFKKLLAESPQEAFIAVAEGLSKDKASFEEFAKGLKVAGIDGTRVAGVFTALGTNADFFRGKIAITGEAVRDTTSIISSAADKNRTFAATLEKIRKKFTDIGTDKRFQEFLVGAANAVLYLIKAFTAIPFGLVAGGIGLLIANTLRLQASKLLLLSATALENGAKALSIVFDYRDAAAKAIATAATSALAFAKGVLTGQITLATIATTIFNTAVTVLSGPIGIVIRSIALLGGAFLLMSNRSKENTLEVDKNVQKLKEKAAQDRNNLEIEKRVAESTGEQISRLKILTTVAQDNNLKLEVRQKALDEVKRSSDGYLKNLTLENLATKEGTDLLTGYIDKLKETAKAKAVNDLAAEKEKKALQLSTQRAGLQQKFNVGNETGGGAFLKNVGSRIGIGSGTVGQQIRDLNTEIEDNNNELKNLYGQVTTNLKTGQTTVDKIIGAVVTGDDGKKVKPIAASRLSGAQKDAVKEIDAERDLLIAGVKLTRAEINREFGFREGDEIDYLDEIQAINERAINKKLAFIKGKNAEENKIIAELKLEKINSAEETNNKIFDLTERGYKDSLNQAIKQAEAFSKAVQDDPTSTEGQRAQAKLDADTKVLNAQLLYASQLDSLEKSMGAKSLKNQIEAGDAILKTQAQINADKLSLAISSLKDIDKNTEKEVALVKLKYAKLKEDILKSNNTKNDKGSAITILTKVETVEVSTKEANGANSKVDEALKLLQGGKITAKEFSDIYNTAVDGQVKLNNAIEDGKVHITSFKNLLETGLSNLFGFAAGSDKAKVLGETITAAFNAASGAMDNYFNNERNRIEASVKLNQKRLDQELSVAKDHAQSQAEKDSLDRQYAAKKDKLDREAFEKNKKAQRAQAAINLAIQLSNLAVIAFSINPLNIATLGAAGAISYAIQAGLALGTYTLNLARINAATYEYGGNPDLTTTRGGIVKGRSHANGGNPFLWKGRVYEDEIDELNIIRTKNAPANKPYTISGTHTQIASALNQLGGGKAFAPGAVLKKFAWGGGLGESLQAPIFIPSNQGSVPAGNQLLDVIKEQSELIKEQNKTMQDQTRAINGRIDKISVHLDTKAVTDAQKKSVRQGNIGSL